MLPKCTTDIATHVFNGDNLQVYNAADVKPKDRVEEVKMLYALLREWNLDDMQAKTLALRAIYANMSKTVVNTFTPDRINRD